MKEYLNIYENHKDKIEDFIHESLINIGELKKLEKGNYKVLFSLFPSLELVYSVDKNNQVQTSPNYYRYKLDESAQDHDRSYLFSKLHFKQDDIAFSSVYVSSATRNNCITATVKDGDSIIFLDFNIEILLEKLNLIEFNKPFHTVTKAFYALAGFSMGFLSLFIILYAMYEFVTHFLLGHDFALDAIFKPVIALTLGIAIFDLAKTILEQEVFFKSYSQDSRVETKMITKFLITIIIALSIEALMVVFKIALKDYDKMVNALYLISGVSLIIIALSLFIYLTKRPSKK
ncbi:hypothetical protein [Candidatus Marinarcus aquaticus]|uniref:General glycosylation pathway protein n=1 Tax=Candidatus Marinarcus aquaticus TaxID=2044504 RepID=A0A4Q0XP43_9BACT|nr:hypothetical protein [Candidatus Marinarcus aquaticus]RXJ56360.1 hypothetical protein CRV04_08060 [Candidatus Marinarcus aquaticus]